MDIEVEIRGPLEKDSFNKLKEFFDKNAKFIIKEERLSLLYFRDCIPKDVEEIKDDKVGLRLRTTNKNAEIILKYGKWAGSDTRKEISIPIKISKFDEAIEFFNILGWYICVVYDTKTYVYNYKNIEFSLVDISNFGYSYEAELIASDKKDIEKLRSRILVACKELELREYRKGEFEKQCNAINNTKSLQFDFNKDSIRDFMKKFKKFF